MPSLSYQEKSLYSELVADAAVFLPYFVFIHTHHLTVSFIMGAIVVLILAHILLQAVIALATRNRLTDERDRLIRLRGYRAGYFTILLEMTLGIFALWLHTTMGQLQPERMALHFLSVFVAFLLIAEIVKTVTQILAYRRPL